MKFNNIPSIGEPDRLPRVGKIHIGVKVKTSQGKEYPRAVDHFVCPPEIHARYGDTPKVLDVILPHDDPFEIFPFAYKAYKSGQGLWCIGNGEKAERRNASGKFEPRDCPCEMLTDGKKACRMVASLKIFIPSVTMGGIYQLDTGSVISLENIRSGLKMIQSVNGGRLLFAPALLSVVPADVNPDGKRKTVYVLTLTLPSFDRIKALGTTMQELRAMMSTTTSLPALPESDLPTDLEQPVIGDLPPARVIFDDPGEDVPEDAPPERPPIQEPTATPPPPADGVERITPEQARELWRVAKGHGFTAEQFRAKLEGHGLASTNDLPLADLDAALRWARGEQGPEDKW
jgi:hypothetical protein